MAKLFLVRHGKSEWNKLGLWTGWTDVELIEEGFDEAARAGEALKDEEIHSVHTSPLKRTHQTFDALKRAAGKPELGHVSHPALNERHYGIHTGKNKWEVKEAVGEEEFQKIRRSWDHPIPEGETLKAVHDRVVPYFEDVVRKELVEGRNVLIVAHGNTLRALVKHLDGMDEAQVSELEIGTGEVYCYEFDGEGNIVGKEIKASNENKGKV